jgi:hypothetical protein
MKTLKAKAQERFRGERNPIGCRNGFNDRFAESVKTLRVDLCGSWQPRHLYRLSTTACAEESRKLMRVVGEGFHCSQGGRLSSTVQKSVKPLKGK